MKRNFTWLSICIAGCAVWLAFTTVVPLRASEQLIEFPVRTSARAMAAKLASSGIIRNQYAFLLLRLLMRGSLKAGEYRFAGPANAVTVYERIQHGDVYTRTVLIPDGYNLFEIANAVQAAGLASSISFRQGASTNADLVAGWAPEAHSLEGFLFPDTYRFSRHVSVRGMQEIMVRRFRAAAAQASLSDDVYRVVTLASLVEKEVRYKEERSLAAGVFTNRLALGMPLQTDPSVVYAAMLENRWTGTIHRSDLRFASPYNTYLRAGLPPGPICSPGLEALIAAMHPANTDKLYFVADGSGHTVFSGSLKEHERHVAEYRQQLSAPSAK